MSSISICPKSPEYVAWSSMKQFCYNKNNNAYKRIGAKGIIVCDRWKNSFSNFLEDMGPRPSSNHTLCRLYSDANYGPGTCAWLTPEEYPEIHDIDVYELSKGLYSTRKQAQEALGLTAAAISYRVRNKRPLLPNSHETPPLKRTRQFFLNGRKITIKDIANITGANYDLIRQRLNRGSTVGQIIIDLSNK